MKDLKILESKIINKLEEIREKDVIALNDEKKYKELQEDLRMVRKVINMIKNIGE